MEINLYAPVDCEVKSITKCSDEVFSQKMLGDGIVIVPDNGRFVLPFDKAKCKMTFDTKHAYGFKINNEIEVLIHCGIDTVKLNGKPFTQKVKLEQNLKLNDPIFEVDLEILKENNITSETPIVFDPTSAQDIKVINLKEGKYKKGELICKISYKPLVAQKKDTQLKEFKSKYQIASELFVNAVGGRKNFSRVYNCMTRLRFNINDKTKVDEAKIKTNELVKGINWTGDELQIIIGGGECYKVREEIEKEENYSGSTQEVKEKVKKSLGTIVVEGIAGIMVPIIPVLMAAGIFGALYAILLQSNAIVNPEAGFANADIFSVLMYILSKVSLNLIGVFFIYNTVKYLGGSTIVAILIGLILTSRFLFASVGVSSSDEWKFGELMSESNYGITGWFLFKIGNYPIVVKAYEGSVLPFILSGFICFYADKWIKTWMPSAIDIVFRSALVIILTIIPVMFIAGPILSLLEFLMAQFVTLIGQKLPWGLGVALFALMWQPLVLTGVHVAVAMTLMLPMISQSPVPSEMLPAVPIAVMGQLGACIGIAIFSKNGNLKQLALSSIPAGVFGITEPVIYGVNLPKIKPFLIGCVASFAGALLCGATGVVQNTVGPQGILALLSYDKTLDKVFLLLSFVIAIGVGILLTFIFYKERKNEYKYSVKISNKMKNILRKIKFENMTSFDQRAKKLSLDIKEQEQVIKDYEKYIQKLLKLEAKLARLNGAEEKHKTSLYKKAIKAQKNEKLDQEKIDIIVEKYNSYNLSEKINPINLEKDNLIKENELLVKKYQKTIKELETLSEKFVEEISKETDKVELLQYKNLYWNAINAVEVGYGFEEKKKIYFTKQEKQNLLTIN